MYNGATKEKRCNNTAPVFLEAYEVFILSDANARSPDLLMLSLFKIIAKRDVGLSKVSTYKVKRLHMDYFSE